MILILTAICGEISAQQDVVQGASDLSKYILTPKAAPTPRINGARIFGVRPGSEFLFTIAATGIRYWSNHRPREENGRIHRPPERRKCAGAL